MTLFDSFGGLHEESVAEGNFQDPISQTPYEVSPIQSISVKGCGLARHQHALRVVERIRGENVQRSPNHFIYLPVGHEWGVTIHLKEKWRNKHVEHSSARVGVLMIKGT